MDVLDQASRSFLASDICFRIFFILPLVFDKCLEINFRRYFVSNDTVNLPFDPSETKSNLKNNDD